MKGTEQKDNSPSTSSLHITLSLFLSVIVIFLLLQVCSLIWIYNIVNKNRKLEDRLVSNSVLLLKLTPIPTQEPKNNLTDLETELRKVLAGSVAYKLSDDGYIDIGKSKMESYSGDVLELQNVGRKYSVTVQAYKYIPGLKYENAYEGGRWFVDMDTWYRFLNGVKEGKQTGYVYDNYWGEFNQSKKEFSVITLGKRTFVVSNAGFQPSASWDHEYQTYDDKNKQFVVITLTFNNVGKNDDISCYADVKQIFEQVENSISQIN